jgi:hypothetical protein
MRDTIDMAREAGIEFQHITGILGKETISTMGSQRLERIEQLVALVRADERWEQSKRRGVLAFCPYTGKPRHPSDIASDPHGILILVPDQPLRGMKS